MYNFKAVLLQQLTEIEETFYAQENKKDDALIWISIQTYRIYGNINYLQGSGALVICSRQTDFTPVPSNAPLHAATVVAINLILLICLYNL
jgi:hypothetical protein